MEEHVENFLTNRFGLKNIVHEWMHCIFSAVQNYAMEDSEVSLFSKILNNDIDENFKNALVEYKKDIIKALKSDIIEKETREHVTESANYRKAKDQYDRIIEEQHMQKKDYETNKVKIETHVTNMKAYQDPNKIKIVRTEEKRLMDEPQHTKIQAPEGPNLYLFTTASHEKVVNMLNNKQFGKVHFEQLSRVIKQIVREEDFGKVRAIVSKKKDADLYVEYCVFEKCLLDFLIANHERK